MDAYNSCCGGAGNCKPGDCERTRALREENARLVRELLEAHGRLAAAMKSAERSTELRSKAECERDDVRAEASKRITDEWAIIARALGRFAHPGLSPGENVLELVKDHSAAEAKLAETEAALRQASKIHGNALAEVARLREALGAIRDSQGFDKLKEPLSRLIASQEIARRALFAAKGE